MVEKFYAKVVKKNGETGTVDAFEALDLFNAGEIVTNPKEKASLYELGTDIKLYPNKGKRRKDGTYGTAYFKYYNGEESPLKGISNSTEWSDELKIFIRAFDRIRKFKIKDISGNIIYVFPKRMNKFYICNTNKGKAILKFLVEIDQTYPYSWGYQYNGLIGLEFSITSNPTPFKKIGLEEIGISIYRAKVKIPSWIVIPDNLMEHTTFERVAREVRHTYENTDYILFGSFINHKNTFSEFEEKYKHLKHFEDEIQVLKKQCFELEEEKNRKEKLLEQQKNKIHSQNQQIEFEKRQLVKIQSENKKNEELKADIINLSYREKQLKKENENLLKEKKKLEQTIIDNFECTNSDLERRKSLSFWRRIFKKW